MPASFRYIALSINIATSDVCVGIDIGLSKEMERFHDQNDCCILAYSIYNLLALFVEAPNLIYFLSAVVRDST